MGSKPARKRKEKNGPLLVSRDVLQCLDGFLDRLRLGSLGGLSKAAKLPIRVQAIQ